MVFAGWEGYILATHEVYIFASQSGNTVYIRSTPPPRIPVTNEGLGRDSLLKMVHNPGGDWNPGWGVVPMYTYLVWWSWPRSTAKSRHRTPNLPPFYHVGRSQHAELIKWNGFVFFDVANMTVGDFLPTFFDAMKLEPCWFHVMSTTDWIALWQSTSRGADIRRTLQLR